MATTGAPGNIPLLGDTDPITPIQTPFNAIATALNTALGQTAFGQYATYASLPKTASLGQHATVYGETNALYNGDYRWDGTRWVLSGNSGNVLATDPAGDASIPNNGAETNLLIAGISSLVPQQLDITYTASAGGPVNWGGNVRIKVNGNIVPATPLRIANGGGGSAPLSISARVKAIVPAGSSTITVSGFTDPLSAGSVTYRAGQMWVWQA